MKIVVLGSGKMAQAIVYDLVHHTKADIVVGDVDPKSAKRLAARFGKRVKPRPVDVTKPKSLAPVIDGAACVVGATTYRHNLALAKACIAAKSHFCDLGGNNDVVRAQMRLDPQARRAGVTVIPDCGLAPGLVNVLGYHWAQSFDSVDSLRIRVGGLPQKPQNQLRYALVFSADGLINEYIEDAEVIDKGRRTLVPSMTGLESLAFAKPFDELEAFYTSGGSSTLPQTLAGHARQLDYKTIRYRGHADCIRLLMDLGLFKSEPVTIGGQSVVPRQLATRLLVDYLPVGVPDVVLIRIAVDGKRDGKRCSVTYDCVDRYNKTQGLSAMQRSTGFPVAIVAAMLASGVIANPGVIPQELVVPGEAFLAALAKRGIRFGRSAPALRAAS